VFLKDIGRGLRCAGISCRLPYILGMIETSVRVFYKIKKGKSRAEQDCPRNISRSGKYDAGATQKRRKNERKRLKNARKRPKKDRKRREFFTLLLIEGLNGRLPRLTHKFATSAHEKIKIF